VTKLTIFVYSRWRTAAILTIALSLYLNRGSSDFNKIWCAAADFGSKDGRVTVSKYCKFKMADGCHIENRLLAISPRSIVRLTRNFVWRNRITFRHRSRDQNTKFWKLKMADGRYFENGFVAISRPGIIRFDEIWCADSNFGSRTVTCWFIKKIWNSKMADSRHV